MQKQTSERPSRLTTTYAHDVLEWPQDKLDSRIADLQVNLGAIAQTGALRDELEHEIDQLAFEANCREQEGSNGQS